MVSEVVIDVEKIKELRAKTKKSMSDMSMALGYKTPTGYWNIEQGKRKVSIDSLYRMCKVFGVHMEELIRENN